MLELQSKIQSQVKENIDKSQRRYYLQEQMKAIRKELGEGEGGAGGEVESLREKLDAAKLPENVMKEAERELDAARVDPQRLAGIRRDPHLSADPFRTAVVASRPKTSSI